MGKTAEEALLNMTVEKLLQEIAGLRQKNKELEDRLAFSEVREKAHLKKEEILQKISSPLVFAIVTRNLPKVKSEMKKSGYHGNMIDTLGRSVWDYALEFGTDDILRELSLWGCHHSPNEKSETAWHFAFRSGHPKFLSYLSQSEKSPTDQVQNECRTLIELDRYKPAKTIYGELSNSLSFKQAAVPNKLMPTAIILIQLTIEKLIEETQGEADNIQARFQALLIETVNEWVFASSQESSSKKKVDVTLAQIVNLVFQLHLDMLLHYIEDDFKRPDLPVSELFRYISLFLQAMTAENNWQFIKPKCCFRNRVMSLYENLVERVAEVIKATNAFLLQQVTVEAILDLNEHDLQLKRSQQFCEQLSQYIIQSILSKKSIDDRTLQLEFFIRLAVELFKLDDFQGVHTVISSLNDNNISRLTKTFEGVSSYAWDCLTEYQDFIKYRVKNNRLLDKMRMLHDDEAKFVFSLKPFVDRFVASGQKYPDKMSQLIIGSLKLLSEGKVEVCESFENYLKETVSHQDQVELKRSNTIASLLLERVQDDCSASQLFHRQNLDNIFDSEQEHDGERLLKQANVRGAAVALFGFGGFNTSMFLRPQDEKARKGSISTVAARKHSNRGGSSKRTSEALLPLGGPRVMNPGGK